MGAMMAGMVAALGAAIVVTTESGSWLVPRHYIALHGLKCAELAELAERYGFAKVTP